MRRSKFISKLLCNLELHDFEPSNSYCSTNSVFVELQCFYCDSIKRSHLNSGNCKAHAVVGLGGSIRKLFTTKQAADRFCFEDKSLGIPSEVQAWQVH